MESISAPSLTAIEREIIADIHAFCRRRGWPTNVRPSFEAYFVGGGRFHEKQIRALGGWVKVCARGGMHARGALVQALRASRPATPPPDSDTIVADVRRVAQSLRLKPGDRLTFAVYRRSDGRFSAEMISRFGGWTAVSTAAGVRSPIGGNVSRRRPRVKVKRILTQSDFDRALDSALGRKAVPRGILCMMGVERRRKGCGAAVHRKVPELERGEVIADIRQTALSLGLLSPHLLSFDTYRCHGGRYTYEQTLALGGFDALRRVA